MPRRDRKSTEAAAWAEALTMPKFGYADISARLKIGLKLAAAFVRGWMREGKLVEVEPGHSGRKLWRVAENARMCPVPKGRTPELNMWTAMRKLQSFAPSALAAHAISDDVQVSIETAQGYCRALLSTGYLRATRKAVPGKVEAIYRLCRETGPLAPQPRRVSAVVDPNTDEIILVRGGAA